MSIVSRVLGFVRRAAVPIVIVLAVLALAWVRVASPVTVRTAKVERGTVVEEAFGRGTVESQREAAVGFDLVGRLSSVMVDEGARVTLGQELARLETNQAQADLQAAQTGVSAARSSLARIAADEDRARSVLGTAERELARTESLLASGAIPAQQRDDAADRQRVAQAELDRVLAQRSEATRGIDYAAGGAEQRRVAMVRATLLAPFDGLVTRRLRDPGDTVAIGSTVLRIVDTSRVYVSASIDETVLPQLAPDQLATIAFPGSDVPIAGKVARIAWESDRQTHELVVDVTPDKLDRRVAIGQRADVRIELARHPNVLRVPLAMVQRDDRGPFVWVDRGGRARVARPKMGPAGDGWVAIDEGLAEGDVLLAPARGVTLTDGRKWVAE